ncbi:MAG: DinB family protein [Fimbriimonadaceae bacterium]|nr:DinB family protein [Fimbriimonadaceae bacterium]
MSTSIKQHLVERIEGALGRFRNDLEAMPDGSLGTSPGGVARTPLDITYEIVVVNRALAMHLRGEQAPEFEFGKWHHAPDDFATLETALAELDASTHEVLEAFKAIPEDRLDVKRGPMSAIGTASLVATHLMYHDGQLNYLQSMHGDDQVHWG